MITERSCPERILIDSSICCTTESMKFSSHDLKQTRATSRLGLLTATPRTCLALVAGCKSQECNSGGVLVLVAACSILACHARDVHSLLSFCNHLACDLGVQRQ